MKRTPDDSWENIVAKLDRMIEERQSVIKLISQTKDIPHLSEFANEMSDELEKYSTMLTLVKFQAHPETWDPERESIFLTLAEKHQIVLPAWMKTRRKVKRV